MVKWWCIAGAIVLALPLWGKAVIGEPFPADLRRLEFVTANRCDFAPVRESGTAPKLQVAALLLVRDRTTLGTLRLLQEVRRKYGEKLTAAVLTPDEAEDAKKLAALPDAAGLVVGFDPSRRQISELIEDRPVFPQVFVVDAEGKLCWRGEPVDLPEFLSDYFSGRYDRQKTRRTVEKLDALFSSLRENRTMNRNQLADAVFRLDPGNPTAMRLQLFFLRESGDDDAAWQLLTRQLKAAPKRPHLYLSAVELIALAGTKFKPELPKLLADFEVNITDANRRLLMVWALLHSFEYDRAAVAAAKHLMARIPIPADAADRNRYYETLAELHYRCGDLTAATQAQQQAVASFADGPVRNAARQRLEFFLYLLAEQNSSDESDKPTR